MNTDSPANGSVIVVIPGRFLFFRSPRDDLTGGALWVDSRGTRIFSTEYFAALFDDLGVAQVPPRARPFPTHSPPQRGTDLRRGASQVLRLGASPDVGGHDSAATFRAHGIAVEDLGCGGELSLRALDRFMALAEGTAAAGPMAIQFEEGTANGGDLGAAGTLVAAWMLRGGRFGTSAEALAWLRMVAPGPALTLEARLLCGPARAPARRMSFSSEAPTCTGRRLSVRCASLCESAIERAAGTGAGTPPGRGAGVVCSDSSLLRTQSSFCPRGAGGCSRRRQSTNSTTVPSPTREGGDRQIFLIE